MRASGDFEYRALNHSTVAVIQKDIVKRGKRTVFNQVFRAGDDGKLVAARRSDLDEIHRALDVGSFISVGW